MYSSNADPHDCFWTLGLHFRPPCASEPWKKMCSYSTSGLQTQTWSGSWLHFFSSVLKQRKSHRGISGAPCISPETYPEVLDLLPIDCFSLCSPDSWAICSHLGSCPISKLVEKLRLCGRKNHRISTFLATAHICDLLNDKPLPRCTHQIRVRRWGSASFGV